MIIYLVLLLLLFFGPYGKLEMTCVSGGKMVKSQYGMALIKEPRSRLMDRSLRLLNIKRGELLRIAWPA
jgi:hypothetical protein